MTQSSDAHPERAARQARIQLIAIALCATLFSPVAASAGENDIKSLHANAWNECLDSATAIPAARFAPYAYRSIAVQHPEVYLRADILISDALENLPGSRLAYRSRDARDIEMYLRLARRETKGGTFAWGMVSITPDSIYDSEQPRTALDWLDLRATSVAILLKSVSPRLSTFESSLLRYSQLTQAGYFSDDLYVAVDKDGVGYLVADTLLWVAGLPDREVNNWRDVEPALVFNDRSVYSAITGRDDRAVDSNLTRILARLGKSAKLSFGKDDAHRIARLTDVTVLADSSAQRLAALLASGLSDRNQPSVEAAWSIYTGADTKSAHCTDGLISQTLFWANRLSPRTASLARVVDPDRLQETLPLAQEKFLSWVGRRINRTDSADSSMEAWGGLWSYDLLETTIDDNARTRAGSSASQAMSMSAVLDLAGVDHFQLGVTMGDFQVPDQQWLFAGDGKFQFNFGNWRRIPEADAQGGRQATLSISGFTLRGALTQIAENCFCSPLDDLTIIGHITRISRQIQFADLAFTIPGGEVVPLQKFLAALTDEEYSPTSLLWPKLPLE